MSAHPHRVFFCAEHDLPTLCDERKVTHVVSIGWPPPEDPTQVRRREDANEKVHFEKARKRRETRLTLDLTRRDARAGTSERG